MVAVPAAGPLNPFAVRRLIVAIVVLLVVAGGVAVGRGGDERSADRSSTARSTATTTSSTAVKGPTIASVVPAIEAFVAKTRGHEYKSKVKVTLLGNAEFTKRAAADESIDLKEADLAAGELQALGLLGRDVDLAAAYRKLSESSLAGYYSAKTKELVVRGVTATPYVRSVLAHELTHALDDQWFGLDRPALDKADSEAQAGFLGLTEGSAVRVQHAYVRSLHAADRAAAEREEAAGGTPDAGVPDIVLELVGFPYVAGANLVDAVVQAGGNARLDEAFRSPPTTTEQLLHPARYLSGDGPKPAPVPAADGASIDQDVLGEYGLFLMLAQRVDAAVARRAAQGWGGDRYVAWKSADRTCLRDTMVMDTPADASELIGALRAWAVKSGATVAGDGKGPTTFTICG